MITAVGIYRALIIIFCSINNLTGKPFPKVLVVHPVFIPFIGQPRVLVGLKVAMVGFDVTQ